MVAFSSLARILGECSIIHFLPAFFHLYFFLIFFFFEVEISLRTLISLMPGSVHCGSASRGDCGRMSHDKSCV